MSEVAPATGAVNGGGGGRGVGGGAGMLHSTYEQRGDHLKWRSRALWNGFCDGHPASFIMDRRLPVESGAARVRSEEGRVLELSGHVEVRAKEHRRLRGR